MIHVYTQTQKTGSMVSAAASDRHSDTLKPSFICMTINFTLCLQGNVKHSGYLIYSYGTRTRTSAINLLFIRQ